jgi:trehalose 6-phosphate phosphatase
MTAPPAITPAMALLLDLDGTLIDFAPTPDAVVVPPALPQALRALRARLGDALAVITGRPVEQIDTLLGDLPYAVAGEHGGAVRHAPGEPIARASFPPVPEDWLRRARMVVGAHPGTLLERKTNGVTLHFRKRPSAGPAMRDLADRLLAVMPTHTLMEGSMVWEVRPRGIDKGGAVRALMERPPFAGRTPLFVGDDVTDEDAIVAVRAMGGIGLRVDTVFGSPQGVRDWLAREAARG